MGTACAASAAPTIVLAPHRATYDLSLEQSGTGTTVSANGHMVFEVHDACNAWATEQTLTINSVDRDGHQSATRSDYATFEAKNGRSFNFTMRQTDAGHDAADIRGHASLPAEGVGTVQFTNPPGTVLTLPQGTLFPMSHTKAILQAAAEGKNSLSPTLFDGTGTDGAEYTFASILNWGPSKDAPIGALDEVPSGRIHIAFYPLHSTAMEPEYELGSRYFANGVSDRLDMDFGDYRLHGKLTSLVLLPPSHGCAK